jgi:hypothetical protein
LKAQHLLAAGEGTHEWLFGRGGPLEESVGAYIDDKEFFVVGKVIDLLVEEVAHHEGDDLYSDGQARRYAWALHRSGPRALGTQRWSDEDDGS